MPDDRAILELGGDSEYRDPVRFTLHANGSLTIWIDGGETGDSEGGFYSCEGERTFSADEVAMLRKFLQP